MKALISVAVMLVGFNAMASQSWVCMCYDGKGESLGGIALDIKLTKNQADHEAFGTCLLNAPSTTSVRCEKFDDGRDED